MLLKNIRLILALCCIFMAIVCSVLLYNVLYNDSLEDIPVCGNSFYEDEIMAIHANDTLFISGYELFQANCAACHTHIKDATGPALVDIMSNRSNEWICKFLTDTQYTSKDKRANELLNQYGGLACQKFPGLTCIEVDAILNYIEYYK